ncbi:phage tail spike protein [Latilactobacillus sakei]|uniref:phage tail spike protein n=1 Tax=Latilactobacillus sakei TaxID=1599 RepID=UPI0015EFCFC3|nr:phage tail spike protein [Latilactobacillus sakei]
MSVPILYEANATDFNNLGLGPLVDTTVATVTEERNGQFILEMQYPVDGIRSNLITKNRILKVDAGHKLKDQRFVIKRINRVMGNDGLSYSIYAEHISYITADYALKPTVTVNGSGSVAMAQWLNSIIDTNQIHVNSDITTENTTSWAIDTVQNARQALGGVQGSILDVWGGEYRFDNLNISLLKHRGTTSNTLLSYGRNITDFDQEENITNTYTSIYPFASYSVQNGDTSEQKILTIPDLVVDSEYVKNFPNRKIKIVDFSDKFNTDEAPTVERLTELAKSYIKNNNVGVPTISTKISFVDLSKTENHREFAPLEELDLCDEVPFVFDKFGIKTTAKVSRIVWNALLDSYDSLELGELKTNIGDIINDTNNAANDAKDAANNAKNSADNAATSANGKNTNWYGLEDPSISHLSELREGDSWYKPNGEDMELYYWENGQWVFILSTKDTHDAADAADQASKEADEAKKKANDAVNQANQAAADAGFAKQQVIDVDKTANQAKSDAAAAGQQVRDALTNADTALINAKKALTDSSSALADSAQARKDSATAIKDAADSLTSAKDAISKVGTLTTSVMSQFTTVNNELKSKVNQTDYDKLKGTVTSQQTEISQNANSIKLKADKSYADTINNNVIKNTSSIGLLNNQIALTVSKTELNNTLSSYATQTWTQGQIKTTADQINLSVTKVDSKIENLTTGAPNLLRNTSKLANGDHWGHNGSLTINKHGYWKNGSEPMFVLSNYTTTEVSLSSERVALEAGADYTIQFDAFANYFFTSGNVFLLSRKYGSSNTFDTATLVMDRFKLSSGGTKHLQTTFKVPTGMDEGYIRFDNNSSSTAGEKADMWITNIKFAKENKPSPYAPAPEDLVTDVEFAELEVKVDGITATVASKADKTQITQLANQISLKADTTALNALKGTVDNQGSEITLNTNSIKLKADQSSVNTLKGTVDKQGSAIDVNTKAIALKANQSSVDTLMGRVSTAEGKITVQAGQIAQTVSKTELTSKLNGYATQTWTQGQIKTEADKINLSVSKVQSNLDSMELGSVNLIIRKDELVNRMIGPTGTIDQFAGSSVTKNIISVEPGKYLTLSRYDSVADNNFRFAFYDSAGAMISISFDPADTPKVLTVPANAATLRVSYPTGARVKLERGQKGTEYSAAPEDLASEVQFSQLQLTVNGIQGTVQDKADKSQVTQLANQINLRVQKGDVINQINISPESILIAGQKVHITGQTSIDNAVIKDAMIADVKADKITAGTLNAANVNVINLNANNITTGTLKGANLSMNLNNGQVLFQKGSIESTNGNLNIRIDDGSMSLTNSQGEGAYFIDGKIAMTKNDIWTNGAIHYGQLTFGNNIFGNALGSVSGVRLEGAGGVIVGNKEFNPLALFGPGQTTPSGGGFAANNSFATLASKGWASIEGGTSYAVPFSTNNPSIVAGVSGKYSAPGAWMPTSDKGPASFVKGKLVGLYAEDGGVSMDHGTTADLAAAVDGRSGYILSAATYARTYASGAQMTVTENGVFGRISSASKYKLAINEISTVDDDAHRFLAVKPKQWFDKTETETLADGMTTGNDNYVDNVKAYAHTGFIAEDLYTAGLDSYVIRGSDGSLESIQYDRLPILHHQLIRELYNRLDAAEMEIYKLKQEAKNAIK